jgi:hypothetical protein
MELTCVFGFRTVEERVLCPTSTKRGIVGPGGRTFANEREDLSRWRTTPGTFARYHFRQGNES